MNVGDRVRLKAGPTSLCTHGQIVYWRGEHKPATPRVRWASGWGCTYGADKLELIPPGVAATLPAVQLVPGYDTATLDHIRRQLREELLLAGTAVEVANALTQHQD